MIEHLYDDIIIAILANTEKEIFKFSRQQWHTIVYELKKKFPQAFLDFRFRNKGGFFHESEELDQTLANLQASNLLELNIDNEWFINKTLMEKSFENYSKIRLKKSKIDIEPIVKEFQKMI